MKHQFKNPYEFEGETFTEIDIPLETVTGADLARLSRRFLNEHREVNPATVLFDYGFAAELAARCAKQPLEFFEQMPAPDYVNIAAAVIRFFFDAESAAATPQNS